MIQEKSFIFSIDFYLVLLAVFTVSVIIGYFVNLQRLKKRNKELERIIDERIADIRRQNQQLKSQSLKLESYFESTSESIKYAGKIQHALLPHADLLKHSFKDSFIYLSPKEAISGDFYWMADLGDKIIIAVVDCTGHGVPGAFMSVLGSTLLDQIVIDKKYWQPDLILTTLNNMVEEALKQHQDNNSTYDGFDIGLCTIIPGQQEILFAGAKRPLVYAKGQEVMFIQGDKYAIGGGQLNHPQHYSTKRLTFPEIDYLYLYTDGVADQFGGPENKKFSRNRVTQLLTEICHLKGEVQKEKITSAIEQWQAGYDQLDDMLMIGINIADRS
ncbi:SpoIIE family protein phosphatase [Fulvivirgaceae bacterium BMA12]|uniref:SpoIIE family protein phosphatase n=1 Tax=Agaribacillus aureus TaxID=3051825 RepID=A0ABT8L520_9BACT|nr:SpoIIE family protein phosphatase [Fulvivirgaceae bacterium BMA12]